MKLTTILLVLVVLIATSSLVCADVLIEDTKIVGRCVKISNIAEYPDISVIGYISGPMLPDDKAYVVNPEKCLFKGYKFNQLSLYWDF
ncbi:hypothetical protein JW868_03270, partial [Candidatus Woesearchaeota archaeon]|nr:hypothetical protein [Candidatus Woesearchaeota archaeon]